MARCTQLAGPCWWFLRAAIAHPLGSLLCCGLGRGELWNSSGWGQVCRTWCALCWMRVPGSQQDSNSHRGALRGWPPSPALGARVSRGREEWTLAPHAARSPTHVPRSLLGRVSLVLRRLVVDAEQFWAFCLETAVSLLSHDFSVAKTRSRTEVGLLCSVALRSYRTRLIALY